MLVKDCVTWPLPDRWPDLMFQDIDGNVAYVLDTWVGYIDIAGNVPTKDFKRLRRENWDIRIKASLPKILEKAVRRDKWNYL